MPEIMPKVSPILMMVMIGLATSIIAAWIWVILRLAFRLPVLPPRASRLVPWGAGSVLAAILVYFSTQIVVVSLYAALTHRGPRAPDAGRPPFSPFEMMGLSAVYNLATLILVPATLALTSRARLRDLGLSPANLRDKFALGLFAYPILAPLVFGTMLLSVSIWKRDSHPLERAIADQMSPGMGVVLVLAGVVLAPLAEELMFRGVLLGWLTRLTLKPPKAGKVAGGDPLGEPIPLAVADDPPVVDTPIVVEDVESFGESPADLPPFVNDSPDHNPYAPPIAPISPIPAADGPEIAEVAPPGGVFRLLMSNLAVSLLFAAMHAPVWPTPIPIFFLSIGLGVLYQRTGGLVAPIALHMTFNGISTLLMFLSLGMAQPKDPKVPDPIPQPAQSSSILGKTRVSGTSTAREWLRSDFRLLGPAETLLDGAPIVPPRRK